MKILPHIRSRRNAWLKAIAVALLLFIVLNGVVALAYRQRIYPNSSILGVPLGNMNYGAAQTKLVQANPLPRTLTLQYQSKKTSVATSELGVSIDSTKFPKIAAENRKWLPLQNLFGHHVLPAPLKINQVAYKATTDKLTRTFRQEPLPAHVSAQGDTFKANQAKAGYQLNTRMLEDALTRSITRGESITVPVSTIPPAYTMQDPGKALQAVQPQIAAAPTFRFGDKTAKASTSEVASWFVQSGDNFVLSEANLRATILNIGERLGVLPQNIDQATSRAASEIKNARSSEIKLFAKVKVYQYCTAVRGVATSYLSELSKRAALTLQDARSWSLDGQVIFQQVSSGCQFTIWLVAPSEMPSFGAICDSTWSCNIGSNVVINFDRWQNATSSWNAARAGSIDEYRAMAINHEAGHQLGFGHSTCPAAGQPALVMQQQSVDLQGCKFNAWPTASEQNMLRAKLGL